MSTPILAARAFMAASGPMRVGSMRPSMAASMVPLRATSESGQTTAGAMAGRSLQPPRNLGKGRLAGAGEGYFRKWPDNGGGNGRQELAALDELVKDVIVGWMANQRVNGNGFSQRDRKSTSLNSSHL